MADVASWDVFAYMDADDGTLDEHRLSVPEWRIEDVLRWCRSRGYDNIYLHRDTEPATFQRASPVDGVTHHMGDTHGAAAA